MEVSGSEAAFAPRSLPAKSCFFLSKKRTSEQLSAIRMLSEDSELEWARAHNLHGQQSVGNDSGSSCVAGV